VDYSNINPSSQLLGPGICAYLDPIYGEAEESRHYSLVENKPGFVYRDITNQHMHSVCHLLRHNCEQRQVQPANRPCRPKSDFLRHIAQF
jgi:hypothetical protein